MLFEELKTEKKITTAKLNQLAKKGIETVDDMVRLYPKFYCDYRKRADISKVIDGEKYAFHVRINGVSKRMGKKVEYVTASCTDIASNAHIQAMWFNPYVYNDLCNLKGEEAVIAGTFKDGDFGKQIINPDYFTGNIKEGFCIRPVYKKIPGMSDDYFNNLLNTCIKQYPDNDTLNSELKKHFNLIDEKEMIQYIHHPKDKDEMSKAMTRLVFESLYPLAYKMINDSLDAERESKYIPKQLSTFYEFANNLPYELTADQKNIINQFIARTRTGKRINSLVQGDVGCGKTVVAFSLMIIMADNGFQSALMAPTGILAKQHYEELCSHIAPLGFKAAFLGSNMKPSEKKQILKQIKEGEVQFVVGTHAVISDCVEFKNLALTIVDEEHKFGVAQREKLALKADDGVHNVSMSATPIPRSLALTIYGESTDVYTIETMPNGRKPVQTAQTKSLKSTFDFMKKEIDAGHQCYVVCPMIGDPLCDYDDKDDEKPVSVEEIAQKAEEYFAGTGIQVAIVTGKMKEDEKNHIINEFSENKSQVLIATTIIEVGVNVPNATVIAIMNAERFGLAGLHQLRGRVGRSNLQSYCILCSEDEENPRLEVMCKTTNGFEIAEEDLKLRGTGDFLGTKQSGQDKNVMLMLKYPKYYNQIKEYLTEHWESVK